MSMTTTMPWSDVPPSCVGRYWFRNRDTGREIIGYRFCLDSWDVEDYGQNAAGVASRYQFGPRVLTADETVDLTAEVERLRADIQQVQELRARQGVSNLDEVPL